MILTKVINWNWFYPPSPKKKKLSLYVGSSERERERELLIQTLNYINAFMLHKKQQPQFSNAMKISMENKFLRNWKLLCFNFTERCEITFFSAFACVLVLEWVKKREEKKTKSRFEQSIKNSYVWVGCLWS